jgi:hypothetical protein
MRQRRQSNEQNCIGCGRLFEPTINEWLCEPCYQDHLDRVLSGTTSPPANGSDKKDAHKSAS